MTVLTHISADPSHSSRKLYTIVAASQIEACRMIRRLMDSVDTAFDGVPGHAEFSHPYWTDGAWHSNGYVEIYEVTNVG